MNPGINYTIGVAQLDSLFGFLRNQLRAMEDQACASLVTCVRIRRSENPPCVARWLRELCSRQQRLNVMSLKTAACESPAYMTGAIASPVYVIRAAASRVYGVEASSSPMFVTAASESTA